ncbi:unnamed protein product [Lota lota]
MGNDLELSQAKPAAKRNHLRTCDGGPSFRKEHGGWLRRCWQTGEPSTRAVMEGDPAGNKQRECQPRPGDLIEIFRSGYQHWAVYVGEDEVVHLTISYGKPGTGACCASSYEKAVIRKHKLSRVIGGCRWRINNVLDRKWPPRAAGVIVEEALALVGSEENYSIVKRNCEHIATELRYGKANSRQGRCATDLLSQPQREEDTPTS